LADGLQPRMMAVDPFLGDNRRPYALTTPGHIEAMKRLAAAATLLTPNVTEACLLAGTDPCHPDTSPAGIETLCRALSGVGTRTIVVTGVLRENALFNCALDDGVYAEYETPRHPMARFGTGDLFSSVLVGSLLTGYTLGKSISRAACFVSGALSLSRDEPGGHCHGVCFEPLLTTLTPKV